LSIYAKSVNGTIVYKPKDAKSSPPAALPSKETATDYVTVGSSADLNKAMDAASMAMINLISEKRQLDRLDAYGLGHGLPYRAANRQRSRRSLPNPEEPVARAGAHAVIDGRHLQEQGPTGRGM